MLVALTIAGAASAGLLGVRSPAPATSYGSGTACSTTSVETTTSGATAASARAALARPQAMTTRTAPAATTTSPANTGVSLTDTNALFSCALTTATPTGTGTTRAAATVVTSNAASTLILTGHGWGHGMGMSQYGAYGYALHGWSAAQILHHYYVGTTIGLDPPSTVRVLLSEGHRRVRLGSASPWRVVDGAGTSLTLPAGPLVVSASLLLAGHQLVSPLSFSSAASPLAFGKRPYHGSFLVISNGKSLQVVNVVGMESYLDGVVGSEMPGFWPAAALQAQAVAARSYALAQLEDVVTASPFDLYDDSRSQVYGGIDAESPAVSAAVAATAHEVVLYGGKVATTYYSSSSGGETVSAAEAIGTPVPYLVAVPDPYDTLSPFHNWGPVLVGAATAGTELGLVGPARGSADRKRSLAPRRYRDRRLPGRRPEPRGQSSRRGPRAALELVRGRLAAADPARRPRGPRRPSASLSGLARGVSGGVWLEAMSGRRLGAPVDEILPGPGGAFSVGLTPTVTTRYRLAAGTIRAAAVTVAVAASVTASLGEGGVAGSVTPAVSGGSVSLQRQNGNSWITVATGSTGEAGVFSIPAQLKPGHLQGALRSRQRTGGGFLPGIRRPGELNAAV